SAPTSRPASRASPSTTTSAGHRSRSPSSATSSGSSPARPRSAHADVAVASHAGDTARMTFDVAAESYDRFMGRWSAPLAGPFADYARVAPGQRALVVGCGPGSLTTELVARLGADPVAAGGPSAPFVRAAQT